MTGTCQGRQMITDQGKSYDVDVVLVSYLADSEQIPSHTIFGANEFLGNADQAAGVFKTYDECMSTLAAQTPIFTAETGLSPVAAYCSASTQSFFPGFSLTFDSFGDTKRHLYSYSKDGVSTIDADNTQIMAAAAVAIQALDAHIVWSDKSRLFYYNEYRISVAADNLGMFKDAQQCSSQQSAAMAIYVKAGLVGVTALCESFSTSANSTYSNLMVIGAGADEISDLTADHYDTFGECMSDLNRVIQNAASSGRSVFGGLCSPSMATESGFNAHIYAGF